MPGHLPSFRIKGTQSATFLHGNSIRSYQLYWLLMDLSRLDTGRYWPLLVYRELAGASRLASTFDVRPARTAS